MLVIAASFRRVPERMSRCRPSLRLSRPPAEGISAEELALAARNHGLPLEALRYDLTPPGLHYVLVHYGIAYRGWRLAPGAWRQAAGGGRQGAGAVGAGHGGPAIPARCYDPGDDGARG